MITYLHLFNEATGFWEVGYYEQDDDDDYWVCMDDEYKTEEEAKRDAEKYNKAYRDSQIKEKVREIVRSLRNG